MSDKTSDKRYRITLTENQLALVGTAVEGMMNDLISRKALCDYALNQKDKSVTPNDIMRFPSAQPEQRWIPCSERLPEESGRYLVSVLDGVGRKTTVAPYQPRYKAWTMTGRMAYWKVIAWMPFPEPYGEEMTEE